MFNLFLIIHAVLAVILILSILLQRSDGSALGGLGGGSSNFPGMLEGRRSADFLTKLTTVIGALFLANSLFLAILTKNKNNNTMLQTEEIQEIIIPQKSEDNDSIVPDTEWVRLLSQNLKRKLK